MGNVLSHNLHTLFAVYYKCHCRRTVLPSIGALRWKPSCQAHMSCQYITSSYLAWLILIMNNEGILFLRIVFLWKRKSILFYSILAFVIVLDMTMKEVKVENTNICSR